MSRVASLNTSRGKLRFQISSEYTLKHYGKKGNKYIYLKVEDNPRNRLKAEEKLLDLKEDLINNTFHPLKCEKYMIKDLVNGIKDVKLPSLKELCLEHILWKKKYGLITESTFFTRNSRLNIINNLIQDLSKMNSIIQSLDNTKYFSTTKLELLWQIKSAIEWGISKKKLPDLLLDSIEELNTRISEIKIFLRKNPPSKKNKIHGKEDDTKYFSEEEMNIIIKYFYNKYGDTNRAHIIEFGFRTGLRTEELFALTWGDLYYKKENGEDVMWINVNKAYATSIKKIKSTKTYESRRFRLSKKTQQLCERIKSETFKDTDLVFTIPSGGYFNSSNLRDIWYGKETTQRLKSGELVRRFYPGVVTKLVEEGKISKYLTPYQMRATFINHKLLANVNPALLSKWTGHDVKTMIKHYESLDGSEDRMSD